MKLQSQNCLPNLMQFLCRILHAAGHMCIAAQKLRISKRKLHLAVEALISRHRGIGSPVIFQVELTAPFRKIPPIQNPLLQFLKKGVWHTLAHCRRTWMRHRHSPGIFHHPVCRASATVPESIGNQEMAVQ